MQTTRRVAIAAGALALAGIALPGLLSATVIKAVPAPIPGSHGMYVSDARVVWLADTYRRLNSRSRIYDAAGKAVKTAPAGVGLTGIARHPTEEAFSFCDVQASRVTWTRGDGSFLAHFPVPSPWNARWNASGTAMLVVSYTGAIFRIELGKSPVELMSGLAKPFDLAFAGDGKVWISEQGRTVDGQKQPGQVCLYLLDPQTGAASRAHCNAGLQLDTPEGLWPLPDGGVAVADTGAGNLVRLDPGGNGRIVEKDLGIPINLRVFPNGDWITFAESQTLGPRLIFGNSPDFQ